MLFIPDPLNLNPVKLAFRDAMFELGVACDGGKDSLSMAATADGEVVKAPGNLVVSAYVTCPDITQTVTPDLKLPGSSSLLLVDLAAGARRLGASALAQVYTQVWYGIHSMIIAWCQIVHFRNAPDPVG